MIGSHTSRRRFGNPGALGLTLALNGAAIAAILAWNPQIIRETITWLPTRDFPDPPVPPVRKDDPPPTRPQHARNTADRPVRAVDTNTGGATDPGTGTFDFGKIDPGPVGPIDVDPPVKPDTHDPVRVGVTLDPRYVADQQPPYPPAMQRADTEGSVTVRIHIGSDGRPVEIMLVRADDPAFFAETQRWGLRKWRFRPATEDGKPVDAWYTLTVRFRLNR